MSVVAGSPFDPVEYEGKKLVPGQANNVFIFPGVGFGSVMIKAKTVTDDMFIAAAKGLADYVSKEQIEAGNIYPEINDLRNISATVSLLCVYLLLNPSKKAFLSLYIKGIVVRRLFDWGRNFLLTIMFLFADCKSKVMSLTRRVR